MKLDLDFTAMTIARDFNLCEGCKCQEFIGESKFTCKAIKTDNEDKCIKKTETAYVVVKVIGQAIPVNVSQDLVEVIY